MYYGVSARTGRPSVNMLWLSKIASLICNFCYFVLFPFRLRKFVLESSPVQNEELSALLYPVFVHMYCDLLGAGQKPSGNTVSLFHTFYHSHTLTHKFYYLNEKILFVVVLLLCLMWWLRQLNHLSRECRILGCQAQVFCRPLSLKSGFSSADPRVRFLLIFLICMIHDKMLCLCVYQFEEPCPRFILLN